MKINLIPMAGEGIRFKNAGYKTPKPFILIDQIPMVVRAAKSLPEADKYIFVCRKEHIKNYPIENTLKKYFRNVSIIVIDKLTEGQAITCMCAKNEIPEDATLTIGASDNDMTYDKESLNYLFQDNSINGWVWTFKNNNSVEQNPKMYGWVKTKANSIDIDYISCKIPLSNNPKKDHAIIGAFTFKKAKIFFDAVEKMIESNDRINNEFYVDTAINYAISLGNRIVAKEVNQYVCWGTPTDFENYMYWNEYFKKRL